MSNQTERIFSLFVGIPLFILGLIFLYVGYFVDPSMFWVITGFLFSSMSTIWIHATFTDYPTKRSLNKSKTQNISPDKEDYSNLTPDEFEHHVADLWEKQGWSTKVTSSVADKGIDVIAHKNEIYPEKALIQAKKYEPGNKVTSSEIQQYSSLKQQEDNVDEVIIVTTSSFTSNARARARDLNVKLINRKDLSKLRKKYQNLAEE